MQTSKLFSAVSAAVLLAALVSPKVFAQDSDAQQKAREALRQKMSELDASKAPNSSPKTVTPPPAAEPAKSAPAPAPVTTPPPPPPPATTPEPVVVPKAATPPPAAAVPAAAPAAQATDAEGSEKARAALREKMNQLDSQPTTATAPATAPKSTAKAAPTATHPTKAAQPVPSTVRALETPAPAISASKEARLAELLRKYKADAITPEEYHTQRAAIRAEP
jgi:hypothetical protein